MLLPVAVLETAGPGAKRMDLTEFDVFYTVFCIICYFAWPFLSI